MHVAHRTFSKLLSQRCCSVLHMAFMLLSACLPSRQQLLKPLGKAKAKQSATRVLLVQSTITFLGIRRLVATSCNKYKAPCHCCFEHHDDATEPASSDTLYRRCMAHTNETHAMAVPAAYSRKCRLDLCAVCVLFLPSYNGITRKTEHHG